MHSKGGTQQTFEGRTRSTQQSAYFGPTESGEFKVKPTKKAVPAASSEDPLKQEISQEKLNLSILNRNVYLEHTYSQARFNMKPNPFHQQPEIGGK